MDLSRAKHLLSELVGQHVGMWVVEDLISYGSSGAVFRASHNGATVAVKIFETTLFERHGEIVQIQRVERELTLIGKHHPNLVQILAGGRCERTGYYFMAMEYYPWATLKDVVSTFPASRVIPTVVQLAGAARFLHENDLVHRDIKPSNIVISPDLERVVLLDLGVMKPIGSSDITDSSDFIGTRRYSPPEFVYRWESDDPEGGLAITFYQLGAVLHDLIMCRPLFGDINNLARLIEAIRTKVPPIQSAALPTAVVNLTRACLTKPPKLRLKLVGWADFESPASFPSKQYVADARLHVKDATRALLDTSSQYLWRNIRVACIGNGSFPPLETTRSTDDDTATITIRFATSAKLKLDFLVWMRIVVEVVDAPLSIIRLSIYTCLTPSIVDVPVFGEPSRTIETTSDSEPLLGILESALHDLFDHVQGVMHEVTTTTEVALPISEAGV